MMNPIYCFVCGIIYGQVNIEEMLNRGPVVQSIVSLTTLLRRQLVKYTMTKLSNTLLFFVGKM